MYTILSNGLVRVNLTGCYFTMSEYIELIANV